ncbi:pyrroline-5-carboxylate reductase [Acetobacter sp. AN02]|uniref:pyrroline-5-carboxylate reductase n=1 Tax=Acetobacter sp. AN02 TaxID=2894186 RepID=UPI00243411F5|nr:pyrroline-5-carboxylate reductase [Acetobacter sp. AN02]MDG6095698.1 pyrroline-5-carboxylate reductase [Acetobacter sp. AN02]
MTPAPSLPSIFLVGCGQMGGALFRGWEKAGIAPSLILDRHADNIPAPHKVIRSPADIPDDFRPDAVILATKPQKAVDILPFLARFSPRAPVISVLAGRTVAGLRDGIHAAAPENPAPVVIRAMPNTPAAIGKGITGYYAPPEATAEQVSLCEALLRAAGDVVRVETESLIDSVTALSGSGPAYVFLLAELMEKAGIEQGLPAPVARLLARRTISGAGALLDASPEDAAELRRRVTSPGGTTERAIAELSAPDAWPQNVSDAIKAAARRAAELAV